MTVRAAHPKRKEDRAIRVSEFRGCSAIVDAVERLRIAHGDDWLQSLASLFGMLLHLTLANGREATLINPRRPGKSFSTYPTSPPAVKVVVANAMRALLSRPLVLADGRKRQLLGFAVVDPAMESGQLLLGVASFVLEAAREDCREDGERAQEVSRRIARELAVSLWGVDRNPLARIATRTVFEILSRERDLAMPPLKNLYTADALPWLARRATSSWPSWRTPGRWSPAATSPTSPSAG